MKEYLFDFNTIPAKTKEIIYLILLSLNKDNVFLKLKKIFLRITLCMYFATAYTFISLNQRKKKSKNFFKSKKLFFERIAMHKFV